METQRWQERVRRMSEERSWTGYHSPKNLTMALSVEVAELVEIFQWLTEDESRQVMSDPGRAQAVRDEVADVMTYLLRLVDVLDIDLEPAMAEKIAGSERRYPVGSPPSGLHRTGEEASDPSPLPVPVPVLGVAPCATGWVGVLVESTAPRPRVVVARSMDDLVETVREQVTPAVVTGPGDAMSALGERQRDLRCVASQGSTFGSLAELRAAGMAAPSVLRGDGYEADDVLAACAAVAEVLRAG